MTRNVTRLGAATLALWVALAGLSSCGSERPATPSPLSTDQDSPVPPAESPSVPLLPTTGSNAGGTTSANPTAPASTTTTHSGPTWTLSEPGATPEDALVSWFTANDTPYGGDCNDVPAGTELGTWCTSLFSADDSRRIYRAGQIRSEYATWLLLTWSTGVWTITDVAPGGDTAQVPWP